jgi:hypothetical protein
MAAGAKDDVQAEEPHGGASQRDMCLSAYPSGNQIVRPAIGIPQFSDIFGRPVTSQAAGMAATVDTQDSVQILRQIILKMT